MIQERGDEHVRKYGFKLEGGGGGGGGGGRREMKSFRNF